MFRNPKSWTNLNVIFWTISFLYIYLYSTWFHSTLNHKQIHSEYFISPLLLCLSLCHPFSVPLSSTFPCFFFLFSSYLSDSCVCINLTLKHTAGGRRQTARQSFIFRGTLEVSFNRSMLTQYWHNWASERKRESLRIWVGDNFPALRQSKLHYALNKEMHTERGGRGEELKWLGQWNHF